MTERSDKLYVNLSASQARKRLKGFGHGVKKVQAAGKKRAVIFHTATGQHLRELEGLLADVIASETMEEEHPLSDQTLWEDVV